jgi:hypothetical protein
MIIITGKNEAINLNRIVYFYTYNNEKGEGLEFYESNHNELPFIKEVTNADECFKHIIKYYENGHAICDISSFEVTK